MIQFEYLNDYTLIKHYSDQGFLLLQVETGAKYSEPIDIVPCPFTYIETDEIEEELLEEEEANSRREKEFAEEIDFV